MDGEMKRPDSIQSNITWYGGEIPDRWQGYVHAVSGHPFYEIVKAGEEFYGGVYEKAFGSVYWLYYCGGLGREDWKTLPLNGNGTGLISVKHAAERHWKETVVPMLLAGLEDAAMQ
jgi:hypothetical protein